jgi:hypothetical protein
MTIVPMSPGRCHVFVGGTGDSPNRPSPPEAAPQPQVGHKRDPTGITKIPRLAPMLARRVCYPFPGQS